MITRPTCGHRLCTPGLVPHPVRRPSRREDRGRGREEGDDSRNPHGRPGGVNSTRWPPRPSQCAAKREALVDRRAFLGGLTGGLFAAPLAAAAPPAGRILRLGLLYGPKSTFDPALNADDRALV